MMFSYLLRKPGPVGRSASLYGSGGMWLDPLRPPSGRWPTNLILTHLPECTERECERGCAVAGVESQLGENVDSLSRVGTPLREESPW